LISTGLFSRVQFVFRTPIISKDPNHEKKNSEYILMGLSIPMPKTLIASHFMKGGEHEAKPQIKQPPESKTSSKKLKDFGFSSHCVKILNCLYHKFSN